MKSRCVSVLLSAGLALAATAGCAAQTDASPPDEGSAPASSAAAAQPTAVPEALSRSTLELENAFSDQFVRGQIDRTQLAELADAVVQAVPEDGRADVQQHIDDVLQVGEQAAAEMTPEERAQLATPPSNEQIGQTEAAVVGDWGWPGYAGWGGEGAFGFPAMRAWFDRGWRHHGWDDWGHGWGHRGPYWGRRWGHPWGWGHWGHHRGWCPGGLCY